MQNALNYSLFLRFIYLLLFCALPGIALGANITSKANGNWSTKGTWVGNTIPKATDNVTIAHTVTITAATPCVNVTINAGKILVLNNAIVFTVTGVWTNNGTFTPNTGTVTFGAGTPSIAAGSGLENFNNVTVASGSALTIITGADVTVGGTFAFITAAANNSVTLNGTATLAVTGTFSMPNPSATKSSTLAIGLGAFTASGSFTMSGTTATQSSIVTIGTSGTANFLDITTTNTAGSIITVTGSGTINISGAISANPPNLTPATGTVNFKGSIAQTIPAFTFYKLILSNSNNKTVPNGIIVNVNNLEVQDTAVLDILGNGVINITNP